MEQLHLQISWVVLQVPSDMRYTMDVLAGFAANPNIYGTIIIANGCETCQCHLVEEEIRKRTNKPLRSFIIRRDGGTINLIAKAVRAAREMVAEAGLLQKEEFPITELILATECGGSDPTSRHCGKSGYREVERPTGGSGSNIYFE